MVRLVNFMLCAFYYNFKNEKEKSPYKVLHYLASACLSNFISYLSLLAHCTLAILAFCLLLNTPNSFLSYSLLY